MWSLAAGRLPLGNPSDATTLAALALPHVLYAAVWLHAPLWRRAFGRKSVPVLEWCALAGKSEYGIGRERGMKTEGTGTEREEDEKRGNCF